MKLENVSVPSILFLLLLTPNFLFSQQETFKININNYCAYSASDSIECGKALEFEVKLLERNNFYYAEISKVLNQIGIHNNIQLYSTKKRKLEGLFIKEHADNLPKIIINEKYLTDTTIALVIIFHELGHYLNDNENLCSNPNIELDADQFSGVYMAKLNQNKNNCLRCFEIITEGDGVSHPLRASRKSRFLKGWDDGMLSFDLKSFTSINPSVTWEKTGEEVRIFIDEKTIILNYVTNKLIRIKSPMSPNIDSIRYDDKIGLLYVSNLNSSYQLLEPQNSDHNGLGRLVNDRTAITYLRLDNKFRYYVGGIEVANYQTKNMGFANSGKDFFVEFTEQNSTVLKKVVFKNYGYSKKMGLYIQPAIYQ